jgi:putative transposase
VCQPELCVHRIRVLVALVARWWRVMAQYAIPDGWTAQAYRFALDPSPRQLRALESHCGAARFAFNHMLDAVKKNLDQRAAERSYGIADEALTPAQGWSLPKLRKTWNQHKPVVAPWWQANSKEAYNSGLDALARALQNWASSRAGERARGAVGFPRYKRKHCAASSVRFTTGAIRIEPDRHHVVLPRLGKVRTHESTRTLARRLEAGTAKILSATVSCRGGRWYCAFQVIVRDKARPSNARRSPHPVVGVDVGVKDLLVVATPDGVEVDRIPAPKSLAAAQAKLRSLQRRAARQHGPYELATQTRRAPSTRWQHTQARIGRVHARVTNIRHHEIHTATTTLAIQHQVVVAEQLNANGLARRNLARLGDPSHGEMGTGTGSRPAASIMAGDGRGSTQKTSPTTRVAGQAGGDEAPTPHTNKTGTVTPEGEAA